MVGQPNGSPGRKRGRFPCWAISPKFHMLDHAIRMGLEWNMSPAKWWTFKEEDGIPCMKDMGQQSSGRAIHAWRTCPGQVLTRCQRASSQVLFKACAFVDWSWERSSCFAGRKSTTSHVTLSNHAFESQRMHAKHSFTHPLTHLTPARTHSRTHSLTDGCFHSHLGSFKTPNSAIIPPHF